MRMTFKSFDSKMASREKLFKAAVEFANKIDRKDLINITHSEDRDNIVITIWYYTDEADKGAEIKAKRAADMAKIQPTGTVEGGPDLTVTPVREPSKTQTMPRPNLPSLGNTPEKLLPDDEESPPPK
jgi:hypothetical protein